MTDPMYYMPIQKEGQPGEETAGVTEKDRA